jgi:hypothetical protein
MANHLGQWLKTSLTVLAAAYCLAVDAPGARGQPPPARPTDYSYFDKLKKQSDEQQKIDDETRRKVNETARKNIDTQAKAGGGAEQARRDHGASLGQINDRLPKTDGQTAPADSSAGPRLEPGARVEVVMKNGNYYSGTLIGIDGAKVRVQTIPDPEAKPSEFNLDKIAAFRTSDGMFAYNRKLGRFEPALAVYRLNRSSGVFERTESSYGAAFLTEPARVLGPPPGAVWGLVGIAQDGAIALALPIPQSESPEAIPADRIQEIVTSAGVYSYDPKTKDFTFKSHAQFAEEARQQRDAAGQAYYDKEWARRMLEYQVTHPPVVTMLPYYEVFFTTAPKWPWWQLNSSGAANRPSTSAKPPV